jgi:DNA-binding LacI/PurR family transcriptional regulator
MIKARKKAVRISDVAEKAGVSYAVASLALAGKSNPSVRYGDKTRKRILITAERLGYRPNRTARNLQNRRHNAIGIYVGASIYNVHDRVLNHLLFLCCRRGIFPVVETFSPGKNDMPISLSEHSIDGAMIFENTDHIEREIAASGLPSVFVNTSRKNKNNCITYDEHGGIILALRHLKKKGRLKSGFIYCKTRHYSKALRIRALKSQNFRKTRLLELKHGHGTKEGREEIITQMRQFLKRNPDIDSVILAADVLAPLFYRAAEASNLRIPQDIAVIAYNDLGVSQLIQPEVSALTVDYHNLAEDALAMLYKIINNNKSGGPLSVPYQLVERQSA